MLSSRAAHFLCSNLFPQCQNKFAALVCWPERIGFLIFKEGSPMWQDKAFGANFLYDLLTHVSRATTKVDGLLQFVLERALALTASGGGAIFVFEASHEEPSLAAAALRGELGDTAANLLKAWEQNPDGRSLASPAFIVLQSGQPYSIDDYQHDSAHFPLLKGGRSSLWAPLLDGKSVIGVIHVESSQPEHYRKPHLDQLESLAAEMVPAIQRLLLKEKMAQVGAPIVEIVGASAPFLELERQIRLAAGQSLSPVLITGERGSGKELTAWAIHSLSKRRDKPFVPVLASAFTESLFADELFGHMKHAFTGATEARKGKFVAAEGGSIFFDEVGDLPLGIQVALFRAIERGEIQPIGHDLPIRINVRVIAATNQNLPELIAQRRFREDLYDRLSVFEIKVPPLRERREDIPLLVSHFLRKCCQKMRRPVVFKDVCAICQNSEDVQCVTTEFYQALQTYEWPGNVRELENIILRLLTFVPDEVLDVKHLPDHIQKGLTKAAKPKPEDLTLETAVKQHIRRVLRMTNDNQSQAAKILNLPLSTLRSKIKKLEIERKGK
jgi:DNA-binding NtrC family response regulator